MRCIHRPLVVLLVACVGAGCTPAATGAPSPPAIPSDPSSLATWDTTPTSSIPVALLDASAGQGTLDISATCVQLLLPSGRRVLLVWPEPTAWDAATHTITFVDPRQGDARVALRHGDQIEPGGYSEPREPYVAPSDPSCPTDETFIVNQVRVLPNE